MPSAAEMKAMQKVVFKGRPWKLAKHSMSLWDRVRRSVKAKVSAATPGKAGAGEAAISVSGHKRHRCMSTATPIAALSTGDLCAKRGSEGGRPAPLSTESFDEDSDDDEESDGSTSESSNYGDTA
jgi:hypothetical protein